MVLFQWRDPEAERGRLVGDPQSRCGERVFGFNGRSRAELLVEKVYHLALLDWTESCHASPE